MPHTSGTLYIASSLNNLGRVRQLRDRFLEEGVRLTWDWTTYGYVDDPARLIEVSTRETEGVAMARCLLLVTPAREGSHWEAGMAFARRTPIVLLDEQPGDRFISFHQRPELLKCTEESAAVKTVLELLGGSRRPGRHIMERFS